jgi:hypothetical protein
MVGVSLVDMLRRQRRKGEIRHQDQADSGAAEGTLHFPVIMVANERCVKLDAGNRPRGVPQVVPPCKRE